MRCSFLCFTEVRAPASDIREGTPIAKERKRVLNTAEMTSLTSRCFFPLRISTRNLCPNSTFHNLSDFISLIPFGPNSKPLKQIYNNNSCGFPSHSCMM